MGLPLREMPTPSTGASSLPLRTAGVTVVRRFRRSSEASIRWALAQALARRAFRASGGLAPRPLVARDRAWGQGPAAPAQTARVWARLRDDARLVYGRGLRAPPRGHDPRGCERATPRCGGAAHSGWRGVREAGVSRSSRSGGGWSWHACDARQRWSHRPPARSGRGAPRLRCRRRPSPFRRPRAWTAGP